MLRNLSSTVRQALERGKEKWLKGAAEREKAREAARRARALLEKARVREKAAAEEALLQCAPPLKLLACMQSACYTKHVLHRQMHWFLAKLGQQAACTRLVDLNDWHTSLCALLCDTQSSVAPIWLQPSLLSYLSCVTRTITCTISANIFMHLPLASTPFHVSAQRQLPWASHPLPLSASRMEHTTY